MPALIASPSLVQASGRPSKTIEEYVGRVRTNEARVSVARMVSPPGWSEPGQRASFDEFTIVLSGELLVEHEGGMLAATAGQAVHARPGEWVRYSTPRGAEYVAVCLPAFTPSMLERDAD